MNGLSFEELLKQLAENGILVVTPPLFKCQVVIRGEHQDYGIAAVHLDGTTLILDLGQPIIEEQP